MTCAAASHLLLVRCRTSFETGETRSSSAGCLIAATVHRITAATTLPTRTKRRSHLQGVQQQAVAIRSGQRSHHFRRPPAPLVVAAAMEALEQTEALPTREAKSHRRPGIDREMRPNCRHRPKSRINLAFRRAKSSRVTVRKRTNESPAI